MSDPSVFLPDMLVEMLKEPLGAGPSCREISGSAMFCDVAGFTPLTEALSVLGKEGAEELTRILNGYFSEMIQITEGYGGDVLRFGGDAMTVFFEGGDRGGVISAAREMMGEMVRFSAIETRAGNFGISMKIGISHGSIRLGIVGGDEEGWDYYAEGEPLDDAAEAEHRASPGHIVFHPSFAVAVGADGIMEEIGDGFARVAGGIEPSEKRDRGGGRGWIADGDSALGQNLQRFVPGYLAERAGELITGEHRGTAVVFLAFKVAGGEGGKLATGERYGFLNETYLHFARTAKRFGGIVNKLDMGDKGAKALFLFGSPFAIERKEEMAVRLARELLGGEVFGRKPMYKIGITSSTLFSGPVGSPSRREFTVMGDGINLAARLMAAVEPGEILVSKPVAEASSDRMEYLALEPIRVKGKREPVEISRPVGEKAKAGPVAAQVLIERDDLCKEISRYLLRGGKPLAVIGSAGSGKSAIMDWAFREAKIAGIEASREQLVPYRIDQPYSAWKSAIRCVLGLAGRESVESKLDARERVLAGEPQGYRPLLNPFLDLPEEITPALRSLSPKERKDLTFAIVARLLGSAGEMAILIDDLHWGDPLSLELVCFVSREAPPEKLRLLASMRADAEGMDQAIEALECLTIKPLTEAGIERFLAELHGISNPPKEVLTWFSTRCHGTPSIISALVTALRSANLLYDDGSGTHVDRDRLFATEFPETLEGLYLARVDRLSAGERGVLQSASILGSSVSTYLLGQICRLGGGELEEAMRSLSESGFLVPDTWGLRSYVRFSDSMLRDAIYGALPFAVKRDGHLKIATFLEPESVTNPKLWPVLAHHFENGGEGEKAREYHRLSGRASLKRSDNVTALKHFEYVCASISASEADVQDAFNLLDIYSFLGRWYNAGDILHRIKEIVPELDLSLQARFQYYLARDHFQNRRMDDAEKCLLKGMAAYEKMGDISGRGKSYVNLVGMVYGPTGQFDKARKCLESALALPKGPGQSLWRAMSAMNLGNVLRRGSGESSEAADCFRTAYGEAVKGKLGLNRGTIASNMCGLSYEIGDFAGAVIWGRKALNVLETFSVRVTLLHAQHNLALSQLAAGNAVEVISLLTAVGIQVDSLGITVLSGFAEQGLMQAHWLMGSLKNALVYGEAATSKFAASNNEKGLEDTLAAMVGICYSMGARERVADFRAIKGENGPGASGDEHASAPEKRKPLFRWMKGENLEILCNARQEREELSPDEKLEWIMLEIETKVDKDVAGVGEKEIQKLEDALALWPDFLGKIRVLRIKATVGHGLGPKARAEGMKLLSKCMGGVWGLRLSCLIWRQETDHRKAVAIRRKALRALYQFWIGSPPWAWEKVRAMPEVADLLKG